MTRIPEPERHFLPPTKYVPNNPMPILIYRNVLPTPVTEESAQAFIECNGWKRQGIVWPAIYARHYHPNVHECYAVLSGSSQFLLGVGKLDDTIGHLPEDIDSKVPGLLITLRTGDVMTHPAGTAHSNVNEEGRFRYLSFFPDDAPHWISLKGDSEVDFASWYTQMWRIPIPQDPVLGSDGFLVPFWESARKKFLASSSAESAS